MYKAIIMDDDPIVRKGLQTMIDWESYGFVICSSSRDGVEGLEQIERYQPDLVLTDIQMPGLNGLEMLHRVRNRFPDMQVIIVTGFRNFDYAREALQLGVLEILLKPTPLEDLKKTVEKAALKIGEAKKKELESLQIRREHEEHYHMLAEERLRSLALGLQDYEPKDDEPLKVLGENLFPLRILLIDPVTQEGIQTVHLPPDFITTLTGALPENCQVIPFQQNPRRSAFLLHNRIPDLTEMESWAESFIAEIKSSSAILLSLSLSSPLTSWKDLREGYRETESLMGLSFLYGKGRLLFPRQVRETISSQAEFEEQQSYILEKIKKGDLPSLREFFAREDLFWSSRQEERQLKRRFVSLLNQMIQIREFYQLSLHDEWDPVQMIDRIMNAHSVDHILSNMVPFILSCTEEIYCILNQEKSDYVERAKDFMKENFREEITLQQTADYACVSIFYLSRLFKQNEGISFNAYLNRIRMDEAKQLLKNTQLKAYEIGERVGISDPYYFSKLFKKMEGMTPSQYRKGSS